MLTSYIKRAHEQTLTSPRTERNSHQIQFSNEFPDIDLFCRVLNHYRITCNLFDQGKPGSLDQDEYVYKNCRSLFDSLDRFFHKSDQFLATKDFQQSIFLEHILFSFGSFFMPFREYIEALPSQDDFRVSNFFYQNADPSGSTFNRLINRYLMESCLARSIRYQKDYILRQLTHTVSNAQVNRLIVSSLGCGSALELCEFIEKNSDSQKCVFHCVDRSRDALFYLNRNIARMQELRPITLFDYPVDIFNFDPQKNETIMLNRSQFIYSINLADYLGILEIEKLILFGYDHLGNGGQFVLALTGKNGIYSTLLSLLGLTSFRIYKPADVAALAHRVLPDTALIRVESEPDESNHYIWIEKHVV